MSRGFFCSFWDWKSKVRSFFGYCNKFVLHSFEEAADMKVEEEFGLFPSSYTDPSFSGQRTGIMSICFSGYLSSATATLMSTTSSSHFL